MRKDLLPELLRGLGVEPFLNDAPTLQCLAEVALDLASRAGNLQDQKNYRKEIELFEWCRDRLASC
jgi:hypothetical protein